MASKKSLFVSAPRLKIKVDGQVIAYAIGLNLNARMDVQPVMCIGSIKPVALESVLSQPVTGTFQIVRLADPDSRKKRLNTAKAKAATQAELMPNDINDIAQVTPSNSDAFTGNNSQVIYKHLDPVQVLNSGLFDIDIYIANSPVTSGEDTASEVLFFTVKDCRASSRATNIRMGSLLNEPISFQGLLASPANESGTAAFALDEAVKEK